MVWTVYIWLRIGHEAVYCKDGRSALGSIKLGNLCPAKDLLACQEGLCYVELVCALVCALSMYRCILSFKFVLDKLSATVEAVTTVVVFCFNYIHCSYHCKFLILCFILDVNI